MVLLLENAATSLPEVPHRKMLDDVECRNYLSNKTATEAKVTEVPLWKIKESG